MFHEQTHSDGEIDGHTQGIEHHQQPILPIEDRDWWFPALQPPIVLPRSMSDVFGNFGIAWEIKFYKLPKYLGR